MGDQTKPIAAARRTGRQGPAPHPLAGYLRGRSVPQRSSTRSEHSNPQPAQYVETTLGVFLGHPPRRRPGRAGCGISQPESVNRWRSPGRRRSPASWSRPPRPARGRRPRCRPQREERALVGVGGGSAPGSPEKPAYTARPPGRSSTARSARSSSTSPPMPRVSAIPVLDARRSRINLRHLLGVRFLPARIQGDRAWHRWRSQGLPASDPCESRERTLERDQGCLAIGVDRSGRPSIEMASGGSFMSSSGSRNAVDRSRSSAADDDRSSSGRRIVVARTAWMRTPPHWSAPAADHGADDRRGDPHMT